MNLLPLEPPSRDLHLTPLVSTEHQAELPVLSSSFPLVPCFNHQFSSFHLLSHVHVFATPWTAARQASLSITNSQSLLKLMSTESVMPSNHLILGRPLLLPTSIIPSIRGFSNKSVLHIRWPKYWSFSFNISPSNEYSGLISFKTDWLDLLAVQGTCSRSVVSSSFVSQWTVAWQAPLSMGFPRQEYWSGLPFFSLEDLSDSGVKLRLLHCRQILYHWATWEVLSQARGIIFLVSVQKWYYMTIICRGRVYCERM